MDRISFFRAMLFAIIASSLFSNAVFASNATLQNASFNTFIAASDSFPSWSFKKDSTGGTRYTITQETTGAYSAPGCLKMTITAGADTGASCVISGSITGLPAKKLVTLTAMVKYTDLPDYSSAMISLQQATLLMHEPWTWTDRKWTTLWTNNPTGTIDWTSITKSDTTADSANVFNVIIYLHGVGSTLWVDDVAVTYSDLAPVTQKAVTPARQGSILNNRISFPRAMAYSLEAYGVNGKMILKTSGVANKVNIDQLGLSSGAYLVKAKTKEKIYSGRVVVER